MNDATTSGTCLSLASRFERTPILSDPAAASAAIEAWLEDLPRDRAAALESIFGKFPRARIISESIAEASPYLYDLIKADAARFIRLLNSDPDQSVIDLLASVRDSVAAMPEEKAVVRCLRQMKAEAGLLTALCDIGGVWPVMRVTQVLTEIADLSVQSAVHTLLMAAAAEGQYRPVNAQNPAEESGLVILAMGKMGAAELNYSSDIDLIIFYSADAGAGHGVASHIEPQRFFVRLAQGIVRILQQRTEDGYVFRVDLRLRPDPSSTQVAISLPAALDYYESEGRTWERAAMIKARACAGDLAAGKAFLGEIAPFVWRRHLDFAALADVHDMKRQMHAFKGHSEIAVEGHNIKLGRGGIREIEFFAQTQQLIAGGRYPELRIRGTLDALAVLTDGDWINADVRDDLSAAYIFLRMVEHRLQMIADEQTHTLPESAEEVERLARFMGFPQRDGFAEELLTHLNRVQRHYAELFERDTDISVVPDVDLSVGSEEHRLLDYIASLGFRQPMMIADSLRYYLSGEHRALRSGAARQAFADLLPQLMVDLGRAENPDAAFAQLDRFLSALHSGLRLFALLRQDRDLVRLVALILGTAPKLGDMLARQPQVLDSLVDRRFFGATPSRELTAHRLKSVLQDAQSYEDFLDRVRLFGQEGQFLIGSRILSGTISAQSAGEFFADLAQGIVQTVHRQVEDQFALTHGSIKGQETAILAMGKLGGREMTASSDLDLLVIYDYDTDHPDSDGARPLHGSQYFARLTHRLISAFTTRTNVGLLYEVDMRLRPSGRAGPVATHISSFALYQREEAWTWEHMALTRARVVSAPPEFAQRIQSVINGTLTLPRDPVIIAKDVAEMRQALATEKGDRDIWDLKYAAGGLIDIEFICQYLQLAHAARLPQILDTNTSKVIEKAVALSVISQSDADVLRPALRLYQDLTQILRLCLTERFSPTTAGDDLLQVLRLAADAPDFSSLEARLKDTQADVREIFRRIVETGASG